MSTALANDRSGLFRKLLAVRAGGSLGSLIASGFRSATLIDAEKFCAQFLPDAVPDDFEALAIPLTVIASDLYARREAAISSGPAEIGGRSLDGDPGSEPSGAVRRPGAGRWRRHQSAALRPPARQGRYRDRGRCRGSAGRVADRNSERDGSLSRNHSRDGRDHHRGEAAAQRARTSRCGPMSGCSARSISCG